VTVSIPEDAERNLPPLNLGQPIPPSNAGQMPPPPPPAALPGVVVSSPLIGGGVVQAPPPPPAEIPSFRGNLPMGGSYGYLPPPAAPPAPTPPPVVTMATPGGGPPQQGGQNNGPINLSQPLTVRTPGSRGGITAIGKVGQQTLPAQAAAQREGEEAKAGAMNDAANRGYQTAAAMSMAQDREEEFQRRAEEERAIQNQARDRYYQQIAADAEQTKTEKVDPNRIFTGENGSTNRMLAIIGGALGGYVQARTGRNPFMESMNATIERDIAAQKSEIESARDSRKAKQSALWGDVEKYGSNEAALMKRRADMWDAVAQQARGFETLAKSDLMRGDAQAMAADAEGHAQEWRLKTAEWMAAHTVAPSGGGVRLNPAALREFYAKNGNPQALKERYEAGIKMGLSSADAASAAFEGANITNSQRDDQFKAGLEGGSGKGINEQTQALSKAEMAAELPKAEAKLTRLKALVDKFGDDLPGVGPIKMKLGKDWKTSWLLSDEGKQVQQEIIGAVNAHFKATGGSVITESEAPRFFMEIFGPDMDPKGVKQWIEKAEQEQQATKATIRAGASPAAAAEYDRRKQAAGGITGGGNYGFKAPGR